MRSSPLQPSLFSRAGGAPADEARPRRLALDSGSWLELVPAWLADPEPLFALLRSCLPWQQHARRMFEKVVLEPRLTAELRDLARAPEPVRRAAERLSTQYGVEYDSVWLNLYRDGSDSTAWHRDWISCKRDECTVPVLTLGTPRRFLVKPRAGGASRSFRPEAGDLVVMGGRCQSDFVHAVPKEPGVSGPRISLNFQSSEQGIRTPPRRW
ncbi:MAG TPA: alpha-ketoglutarate-dependent dioxygenase AlkB [Myxococcota bacterium]|nr:alpha-ketoglutarate-dependent dioxygenase AlkB [Myxococcota bacterium]